MPVNLCRVPELDGTALMKFPVGDRFLAYYQEKIMEDAKVALDMPGHRTEDKSACGKKQDLLYWQSKDWAE